MRPTAEAVALRIKGTIVSVIFLSIPIYGVYQHGFDFTFIQWVTFSLYGVAGLFLAACTIKGWND